MSREKQTEIEEMANILWHTPSCFELNSYNDCAMIAEHIYEWGDYRKASEVAREIFAEIDRIAKLSADAVEVRHGEWIKDIREWATYANRSQYEYICSACGESELDMSLFCPNCGAKMDGERKEE